MNHTFFSKRHFGGGGVMVWAGFAANGTTQMVFLDIMVNSAAYQDILGEHLLPTAPLITSGDYLFQQDIASIHVSCTSKSWFEANFVKLLDWPSKSPDLNPMENLWGILCIEIHKDGKQYDSKSSLISAIKSTWENLLRQTLQKLSESLTVRMIKIIENKGNFLHYSFFFTLVLIIFSKSVCVYFS